MSIKKLVGAIGAGVIFCISIIAVVNDSAQIEIILWPLIIFVLGLFGIKNIGGIVNSKLNGG